MSGPWVRIPVRFRATLEGRGEEGFGMSMCFRCGTGMGSYEETHEFHKNMTVLEIVGII